jgi:hypothetical protein
LPAANLSFLLGLRPAAVKDRELSYGEADRQVADLPRISVAKPSRTQLNESFEIRAIFSRNLSHFPQFIYIEEQ